MLSLLLLQVKLQWLGKRSLVARILHSDKEKENLCREVLQVQLAMCWSGIVKEVKEICRALRT